jgi:two-component system, response regulator, stage 0 sporulation protein F
VDETNDWPVLVVDDDATLRTMIVEILSDEGYPTIEAANGAQALAAADRTQLALILLDMRMPIMNGWEFVDAYRKRPNASVPIVVCTAASNAALWAAEVRADGFLSKPFGLEELVAAVHHFVPPTNHVARQA